MRTTLAVSTAIVLLLVPGHALAGSAGFGATNPHCYLDTIADGVTSLVTGPRFDPPVIDCSITDRGTVDVVAGACDARGCSVTATGSFVTTHNVPSYGLVQAAVARDYQNGSTICVGFVAALLNLGTSAACSGTSAPLTVFVPPGACAPVYVQAAGQWNVVTVNPPVLGYVVVSYEWSRIDHTFLLCRDAAGAPTLSWFADYRY